MLSGVGPLVRILMLRPELRLVMETGSLSQQFLRKEMNGALRGRFSLPFLGKLAITLSMSHRK